MRARCPIGYRGRVGHFTAPVSGRPLWPCTSPNLAEQLGSILCITVAAQATSSPLPGRINRLGSRERAACEVRSILAVCLLAVSDGALQALADQVNDLSEALVKVGNNE